MSINEFASRDAERQLIKYKIYAKDIKRLLIACGIWPKLHPIVHGIFSNIALVIMAIPLMGVINFSIHYMSNVMVFSQNIVLIMSLASTMMRVCMFLLHRDDLTSLSVNLSAQFTQDLQNKNYQSLALHHYRAFSKLFYSVTKTVGITTMITSLVIPLLALRHGKYAPPIQLLFPFTYEPGSPVYWIIQAINTLAAYYLWSVTCGVEALLGLYTLQMCGEFRILAYKFEHLKMSTHYRNELKDCVHRHHLLMKSRDTLEKIFGVLVIWIAITSAIVQCALIFEGTKVLKAMNVFKFSYCIGFTLFKLLQAFMFAWYGNLITEESKLCLDAIYNACWAGSGSKKFMSDVLVVLSQKPLIFRAKGCLNVTMEMFSKIVNTSVSYFFLLQTLESNA